MSSTARGWEEVRISEAETRGRTACFGSRMPFSPEGRASRRAREVEGAERETLNRWDQGKRSRASMEQGVHGAEVRAELDWTPGVRGVRCN